MISAKEISRRLAQQVLPLCVKLIPGGEEKGGYYQCAGLDGKEGQSLKVTLSGNHAGQWKDWADPDAHGDMLDLWSMAKGIAMKDAITEAKEYLGIFEVVPAKAKEYTKPPKKDTTAPKEGDSVASFLIGKRMLNTETIAAFKIEALPGKPPVVVFPCFSPSGQLENRSYRTIPPEGEKKKVWQDTGCAPCLFGWHALPKQSLQNREIVISEGQIDAMSWHQWGIPALSIPAGTGQTWINHEWDNLEIFETIYIAFDMDEAGQKNASDAIKRLGRHRCKLVKMPHKDANEALQKGATALDAAQWLETAEAPEMPNFATAGGLKGRLLADIKPKPMPFTLPVFDKAWNAREGFYFRPGEVTVWTGPYGNGKTTFLNYIGVFLARHQIPSFFASMEAKAEVLLRKLATTYLVEYGFHMSDVCFRNEDGKEFPYEDAFSSCLMNVEDLFTFADVVGYIHPDRLLEMMQFAFRKYGAQHMFIDSLMRVEGLEEDYPAQGLFLNRLQEFSKDTGAHVHLVAHPRKMEKGVRASGMDLKGASLLANNADNIVTVTRNYEKMEILKERDLEGDEKNMHDTEVTIDKQRDSGWVGSFYFYFNHRTFTFKPCKRWEKPKEKKTKPHWNG